MSSIKKIILYCGLLSSSIFVLARTTTNQQYQSVIRNRRTSALSSQSSSSPLSSSLPTYNEQFDSSDSSESVLPAGVTKTVYNKDNINMNKDTLNIPTYNGPANENSFWNDFSLFYKVYRQCSKEDLTVCLKIKLLTGLEKASRSIKEFNLISGIKFIRDDTVEQISEPALTENEITANLPRSLEAKDETLNSLIFSKILSFVKSHTLQIKFDDTDADVEERSSSEARKKKKGHGALIMIPLLLGGTFVPIAYGALALLAGKALIVSKLALVLASIIGIKKLLSGSSHKESEVVVSGGHSSGWGRDFDLAAYSAYAPKDSSKTM